MYIKNITIKKGRTADNRTTTTAPAPAITSSNITPSLATVASIAPIAPILLVVIQESDRHRIENATQGLPATRCFNYLSNRVLLSSSSSSSAGKQIALTICDYISPLRSEINPSNHYRNDTIVLLCDLSIFFGNAKCFNEITRYELLSSYCLP